jgi:SAM-dependent methyltransferase
VRAPVTAATGRVGASRYGAGMEHSWAPVRAAYDTVATDYARLLPDTRYEARLDLAMLADFTARVIGAGPVLDVGCGPGRMTRVLADRGVDVSGIDLAPEMVRIARARHPDLRFAVGSSDSLDAGTGSLAGVLAWYSIIHTPPDRLPAVLAEFLRVLRPGGWLLTAHQSGVGSRSIRSAYGHDLDLTAYLYTADHVAGVLAELGADVHARLSRGPEPPEYREQAFVLARRAGP